MESSSNQTVNECLTLDDIYGMRQMDHEGLLKKLDHLSLEDLTNLCSVDSSVDTFFKDFIGREIIAKNLIDFGSINARTSCGEVVLNQCTIKQFETFGKFMNRFKVCGADFDLFLGAVIKYCNPDTFTEVHLKFCSTKDQNVFQSMPYFSKINKLRLFDTEAKGVFERFLLLLPNCPAASSLQTLQLQQVNIASGWLPNLKNLNELQLNYPRRLLTDDLIGFFKMRPNLITFQYEGGIDISEIFETLSECCPQLETFSDCHITDKLGCQRYAKETGRYSFLSTLTNLTNVTITSYTETGSDVLQISELLNVPNFKSFDNWKRNIYEDHPDQTATIEETLFHY